MSKKNNISSKKNNKNSILSKNTKKNNVNGKKITKKKTPILDLKGPKNKCDYLDIDCLFNVKKEQVTPSDLYYENLGALIGSQVGFDEPYYKKCKNLQT